MSDFWLDNLTKMKSDFELNKLPTITDGPIVVFMKTLKSMNNEYNNTFPPMASNSSCQLLCTSFKSSNISGDLPEMC